MHAEVVNGVILVPPFQVETWRPKLLEVPIFEEPWKTRVCHPIESIDTYIYICIHRCLQRDNIYIYRFVYIYIYTYIYDIYKYKYWLVVWSILHFSIVYGMSMDVILPIDELIFFKMVIAPPTSTPGARRCTTGLRLTGRAWAWAFGAGGFFVIRISWWFHGDLNQGLNKL